MKPKIVTLCGSTRFEEKFRILNEYFTMRGYIVLAPGVFAHSRDIQISAADKARLDELHKEKIEMSDFIIVICPNGYIGESTRSEIEYAVAHNKRIYYME